MTSDNSERILRITEVLDRTGLTRSTLYRQIAAGTFPRQVKLSARCAGWHESAVDAWLRDPIGYRAETLRPAARMRAASKGQLRLDLVL